MRRPAADLAAAFGPSSPLPIADDQAVLWVGLHLGSPVLGYLHLASRVPSLALIARGLDPTLPAMKAIGLREIGDWLAGTTSREGMIERAVIATRQYAKRQRTWFRGRMADWVWV